MVEKKEVNVATGIKAGIWLCSLVAFAALADWSCRVGIRIGYSNLDDGDYLMAMLVIAWLVSAAQIAVHIFALERVLTMFPPYFLVDGAYCIVWSLLTFIASGVFAPNVQDVKDSPACSGHSTLGAAVAFGFFTGILLFASGIYSILLGRNSSFSSTSTSSKTTTTHNADGSSTTTTTTVTRQSGALPF